MPLGGGAPGRRDLIDQRCQLLLRALLIDEGRRHAAKKLQPRRYVLAVRGLHAALGCQECGDGGDGGGSDVRKLQLQAGQS